MQHVGPGTLIGDRYAVSHRLQQHPRWERWAAHDTTLGRDVVILTFAGGTPAAAAAVDAARRAAAVTEPRLVRVLDIVTPPTTDAQVPSSPSGSPSEAAGGSAGGPASAAIVCAIIEEPVERSRSLTRILEQGGLPADEARRITGEAAMALDAAAARGLRHIVLTPRNVLLLPDGSVRVRGVAVEAALLGLEDTPADVGARLDATALVSIGYAALTGRWPLGGADSGLPRAPVVGGTVVAADELGADACSDLQRLARATFVEHAGPSTSADVLAGLRPWPKGPTVDLWGDRRPPAVPSATEGQGAGPRAGQGAVAGGGTAAGAGPAAPSLVQPDSPAAQPFSSQQQPSSSAGGGATAEGVSLATGAGGAAGGAGATSAAATAAAVSAAMAKGARGVGSALGAAGTAASQAASRLGGRARHTVERLSTRPEPATDEGIASAPAAPGAGAPEASSAQPPGSPGSGTPTAPGPSAPRVAPGAPRVVAPRTLRAPDLIREDATLASVLAPVDSPLEDAVPLVPITGELGRDESRLALAIVAGLVVLLAVLGIWGLPKLTSGGTTGGSVTTARVTRTATVTSSAGATGAGATAGDGPAVVASLTPVAIIGAATFDASAGQVASSSAPRGYDGNAATMWRSKWYSNEKFGGLKVPGIGYIVDLGQQTEVRRVTVTLPAPQDITVYVANRASLDGVTAIGSSTGQSGQLVFDAPAGPVSSGQLVIVFVTKLGPDGAGNFRAQVSEVAVSR